MRYVVSIGSYDLDAEEVVTTLVADEAFTTAPTDTPADTNVEARVQSPALVRRDLFDIATTGGASRVGFGEIVLVNDDGGLDWLASEALNGRAVIVRVGAADAAYPSGYTTLIRAVIDQAEFSLSLVRLRLRDQQAFTSRLVQENRYGGTNVLPDGVDGIESDLRGKVKPLTFGAVFNVTPAFVNTSRLIYQVNDGPVRDVMAVYDSGALLARGDDYADQAAMFATQPARGTFRVWKGGGMFRLGSSAVGEVTADVVQGLWPANRTAGQLVKALVETQADLGPGSVDADDIAALDAAQPATLGLYLDTDTTVAAALDRVCQSVGAWWASDAAGVIRVRRFEDPSAETPVATLDADNIVDGSLARAALPDGGVPAWRVTVRCAPNWTVQTSGLVGSVTAARRARLALPFQDAVAENASIRTAYPLAPERVVETLLACRAAGEAEAARLLTLYGVGRARFEVEVYGDAATLTALELGRVVRLRYPRFGLDSGKLFRIIGVQLNPVADRASLTLWG